MDFLHYTLARIGDRPAAAVPGQKTVIITGNSGQPTQYRTYVDPYSTYGTNTMTRGSTVVINVAEDQDPYYATMPQAVPARTMRI
ncbi:uncharacterized protein LOC128677496 isoform X2 [Plodia interpunctella]|uniref:uncharacterized protein LOC128677496 isoform X2 n=1 Tax=Plodia interpunctella TaxID=58824 RepID=UPI002367A50E|nr:uncharacterized protein LOC128677496 isoform X2 [Plodia interpunctella]